MRGRLSIVFKESEKIIKKKLCWRNIFLLIAGWKGKKAKYFHLVVLQFDYVIRWITVVSLN